MSSPPAKLARFGGEEEISTSVHIQAFRPKFIHRQYYAIKGERPVKGFRTFYVKPVKHDIRLIQEKWKGINRGVSPSSSRKSTGVPVPPTTPRTLTSGSSRTRPSTTASSLQSARNIISVKTERRPFYQPLQLMRSLESDVFMLPEPKTPHQREDRETVPLTTVSVPRKGLIKLTGLPYEIDNPDYFDDRKERPAPPWHWDHVRSGSANHEPPICDVTCDVGAFASACSY